MPWLTPAVEVPPSLCLAVASPHVSGWCCVCPIQPTFGAGCRIGRIDCLCWRGSLGCLFALAMHRLDGAHAHRRKGYLQVVPPLQEEPALVAQDLRPGGDRARVQAGQEGPYPLAGELTRKCCAACFKRGFVGTRVSGIRISGNAVFPSVHLEWLSIPQRKVSWTGPGIHGSITGSNCGCAAAASPPARCQCAHTPGLTYHML